MYFFRTFVVTPPPLVTSYAQHTLQRGHCFTLSRCPSRCLSRALACRVSHAGRRPVTMAVGQHNVQMGNPFLCQHGLTSRLLSPFLCKNGTVRRAGKSIIQMLLQEHQMTAGGLKLCGYFQLVTNNIIKKTFYEKHYSWPNQYTFRGIMHFSVMIVVFM